MPRAKRCPVCGSAMRNYAGRWKCMNVKAHDKAKRNPNKPGQVRNPRGINQSSAASKRKRFMKKAWKDPEFRKRQSSGMKEKWKDPEYRKKISAARRRQHRKKRGES